MNKYAIFHITEAPYAYAVDEDTLIVRIRTARGDVNKCSVCYKDRYDWTNKYTHKEMKISESSTLFDFYETSISLNEGRFRYLFKLEDQEGKVTYFNETGFREKLLEPIEEGAFQFPYINKSDVYAAPKWAREGIIYQIMPDRFCNGDKSNDPKGVLPWGEKVSQKSMFGGDLQGIIDKLPYLDELGVNIIYMTPIFLSPSNHKYNTTDYYKIDDTFGDMDKIKELVNKCHERGMKVLLDAVFNHSGDEFFAFKDVVKNGEKSIYKDWFFVDSYPVDKLKVNYRTFADKVMQMPKLNTSNPEVKDYLLHVARFWIEEVHIDGWRLDVCDEVDHEFWKAFRKTVKKANHEAFIVGEIMHEAYSWLKGDQLDSIMNYPFKSLCVNFFAKRLISASDFDDALAGYRAMYMKQINMNLLNLIGSHDTSRFLTEAEGHINRLKMAAAFQYTYIGIPYIYYGDEIGLDGGHDPGCRKCMVWEDKYQNKELLSFYKKLNKIRKSHLEFVYGDFTNLYKQNNVLVFKRSYQGKESIVIINNNDEAVNIKIDSINGTYTDLLSGQSIDIQGSLRLLPEDINILHS